MPSIGKVDSLRLSSPESQSGDVEEMIKAIAQYSKKTQEEISSLVEQVCGLPLNQFMARILNSASAAAAKAREEAF